MGYINVQVTKVPGAMVPVVLNGGATVADALSAANIEVGSGYEIRLNNDVVSTDSTLNDGDVVLVTKMIKGN